MTADPASSSAPLEEFEGAIGIDLGTTYSCVGVWLNGKVEIVPNANGNRTTPSFVAFTKSEKLWGDAAKNQFAMNPSNTVYDAKRLIGRNYNDTEVQKDMKIWPFQVKSGENDKPVIVVEYKGETQDFHPEQISSILLSGLKSSAEKFLNKKVTKAVITVPAYFNDAQRTTTKMAGQLAGLNVLRIINEPTAAALAYGLEGTGGPAANAAGRTVLVFDLGGGTFDVSLIRLEGPVFQVKSTAGNTHLGGQDFDNSMVEHCLKELQRIAGVDAKADQKIVRKLRTACEKAKRNLSAATEDVIEIDVEGKEVSITFSRAKFEQLNLKLFEACMKEVKRVLEDAKIDASQVDDIVMVGGSSRIPKIQSMVSEFFGKPLKHSINPDEAVGFGAAIQGHVLAGNKAKEGDVGDVLLLDVVPLSIGVDVDGGVLDILIKRNMTIPRKVEKTYTTADDAMTEVTVDVFEGERKRAQLNNHLGSFALTEITPGIPSIKVTFEVDANGVLNVSAQEVGGQAKGAIMITNTNRMSKADVDRMLADAVRFQKEDAEFAKMQHLRAVLEPFSYSMLECVEKEENNVESWIVDEVEGHVTWVEEHLADASYEELNNHYTDLKNLHAQLEEMWMDAVDEEVRKKRMATAKGKRKRSSDDSDDDLDWGTKAGADASSSSDDDGASGADSGEEGEGKTKKKKKAKKEKKPREKKNKSEKKDDAKPKPAKKPKTEKTAAAVKTEKPKKDEKPKADKAAAGAAAAGSAGDEAKAEDKNGDGAAPMQVDGEDAGASATEPPKTSVKPAKPATKGFKAPKTVKPAAEGAEGAAAKPKKEKTEKKPKDPKEPKAEKAPAKPKAEKAEKPKKEPAEKKPKKEPKEPKAAKEPKEKKEKAPPKPKADTKKEGATEDGAAAASGAVAASAAPAAASDAAPMQTDE